MEHWYRGFSGVHVTFGAVRGPQEVINDPQLRANDIIVPLKGAGGKLTSTISSPLQVLGVAKVAKRAPKIGEHNDEVLRQFVATGTSRAVNVPSGANLVRAALEGVTIGSPKCDNLMPSFAAAYSDAEIAAVSNYVIADFGGKRGDVTAAGIRASRH
jgi:hypothetical protein